MVYGYRDERRKGEAILGKLELCKQRKAWFHLFLGLYRLLCPICIYVSVCLFGKTGSPPSEHCSMYIYGLLSGLGKLTSIFFCLAERKKGRQTFYAITDSLHGLGL